MLLEEFDGEVPRTLDELVRLPGVARKTANVVAAELGHAQGIVVDTHVRRLSQRLGLTREEDPVKIERDLVRIVPRADWAPLPAPPDLARAPRLRRAAAALRGVRPRRPLPVEPCLTRARSFETAAAEYERYRPGLSARGDRAGRPSGSASRPVRACSTSVPARGS